MNQKKETGTTEEKDKIKAAVVFSFSIEK